MIIDQIVTLRVMLDEMEQDLGLDKLSALSDVSTIGTDLKL